MDVDSAWNDFKKSNQTSVEDKLDVIMAQQQQILTDTSRVADLVPMVTGDKAQEDALDESGNLEGQAGDMTGQMSLEEGNPDDPMNPDMQAMDGEEVAGEEGESDNPFAFLDEDEGEEQVSEDMSESEDADASEEEDDGFLEAGDMGDYELTEEDSDVEEGSEDTSEQVEEEGESADEEQAESEEESEDEAGESEEDYISFDEIGEDEEDEDRTKKSATIPITRTIKSFGTKTPMTIVRKADRPNDALAYGRASSADEISEILTKAQSGSYEDFKIGFGVNPHDVTKNDWAMLRTMMKLNNF